MVQVGLSRLGTEAAEMACESPAVLAFLVVLLLLAYRILHSGSSSSDIDQLPILNARPGELFPRLRAAWRNTLDLKGALALRQAQCPDATVRVPFAVGHPGGSVVLLPAREAKWLIDQPESALSMHKQTDQHFQVAHGTIYPMPDQSHVKLVATRLTRQVGNLVPALADELACALAEEWGAGEGDHGDSHGWREVCVYETLRLVVGRVTNRVFIGAPLCRARALLNAGVAYAQAIPVAAQVLSLLPRMLRPLVAPLVTLPNRRYERAWFRLAVPEVERRLRALDVNDSGNYKNDETAPATATGDFLDWAIADALISADLIQRRPEMLAARVLLVNAAAVHTSAFAITHVLLDLAGAGRDRGAAYVDALRREVAAALAAHGGVWSKCALADMPRLDSTFRESQRLNTVLAVGPLRIVSGPTGVVTPSGVRLPPGYQVGVAAYAMHTDPNIWGPDACEFRPFRFVADDGEYSGAVGGARSAEAWATTSARYLSFGAGRNSCPGRFFAAAELKLLLAHILLHYDIEFREQRPPNQWFGSNHLPPTKAAIRIRRRENPFSLSGAAAYPHD
ncbi:hypothetical protein RB601_000164 [Gaeumannomyces tritici]